MIEIKDYLHLYLGCVVESSVPGDGVKEKFILNEIDKGILMLAENRWIKPILRPLSDMTEEEETEYLKIFPEYEDYQRLMWETQILMEGEGTKYLLSKSFDLFNLIPEGLALDKTKLNSEPNAQGSVASKAQ